MRRALGALTTRGRALLAAGLAAGLCALVLDERDLLRVAGFVVALPLLATLVAGRARLGLHAVRRLPQRAPAGGSCEVSVTVHSTVRLGTGLLLEDGVPAALGTRPRFLVGRLPRGAATELRYRLHPELRGVHPIGPLTARVTDPLGLAEYGLQVAGRDRLVVTPVVLPLRGTPTGGSGVGRATRSGGGRRHTGQGEDDAVVRSYRQGDDLRKVHWRSTARRDELMVRVEERPWGGGTAVLLDHRAGAHRGHGAAGSLEYAVSLAASACLHLQRRGRRVSLVTVDGQVRSGPRDGAEAVLDALAGLVPVRRREPAATGTDAGDDLVAVLGRVTPADVAVLLRHRPWAGRSHAVLLDVVAWSSDGEPVGEPADGAADPQHSARLLAAAGWSVVVAGPGQPPDSAWDRLTSAGRAGAVR